jgi:hypothetical protein
MGVKQPIDSGIQQKAKISGARSTTVSFEVAANPAPTRTRSAADSGGGQGAGIGIERLASGAVPSAAATPTRSPVGGTEVQAPEAPSPSLSSFGGGIQEALTAAIAKAATEKSSQGAMATAAQRAKEKLNQQKPQGGSVDAQQLAQVLSQASSALVKVGEALINLGNVLSGLK